MLVSLLLVVGLTGWGLAFLAWVSCVSWRERYEALVREGAQAGEISFGPHDEAEFIAEPQRLSERTLRRATVEAQQGT
jgi:hypothetical protein